jgi:Rod binding domain-containing protein
MGDLAAAVPPIALLKPLNLPGAGGPAFTGMDEATKRARIQDTAKAYESNFLSMMLGQMFEGTERTMFGGGAGEQAFSGFLTDAMAKAVERRGGIGLAKSLAAEMLKMQGLSQTPSAVAPTPGPAPGPTSLAAPARVLKTAPAPALDIAA